MIVACYAIAFGLAEIGVAAYAAQVERPALAGVFLGVMSAGGAFGGLAYGSRHWHIPLARQFSSTLAVMGVGLLPLALPWHVGAFAVFSTLGGIVMAPALIEAARPVQRLIADKAYDTNSFRNLLAENGIEAVIPSIRRRKPLIPHDSVAYRDRNRVERMWCRLKDFRRVATRYDKLASNYLSGVLIAATCAYWLN